jgi:hypothetical protein
MGDIEASAGAIKATAEATGKVVDAASGLGRFVERIIGPPADQLSGMLTDTLKHRRAMRALRLEMRFEQFRAENGLTGAIQPVGMKFGVPLLEVASLEENDDLQDIYARLLMNTTNPASGIEAKRAFISILQDFGSLEARLFDHLCKVRPAGTRIVTSHLPEWAQAHQEEQGDVALPSKEVQVTLGNLVRLGCIEGSVTWGGGAVVAVVTITALGRALHDACALRQKAAEDEPMPNPVAADVAWGAKWEGDPEDGIEIGGLRLRK